MSNKYKSIFISDFHLGTKFSKAKELLTFLNNSQYEQLYLVGDILDTWNLGPNWYIDENQLLLIEFIKDKYSKIKLIFISGNHDEPGIATLLEIFPSIPIHEAYIYTTIFNKKLLVTHGHQFDTSIIKASSDFHFSLAMTINRWYHSKNRILHNIGILGIKTFGNPRIKKFYENAYRGLIKNKLDGLICGHIHKPKIKDLGNNIIYYNCGDWVENCTAIVETLEGEIKLIYASQN